MGPGGTHTTVHGGRRYFFAVHTVSVSRGMCVSAYIGAECHRHVARSRPLAMGDEIDGYVAACWVEEHVFFWDRVGHTKGLECHLPLTRGVVGFAVERRNTHTGDSYRVDVSAHDTTRLLWSLLSQ